MADESLVTLDDAEALIAGRGGRLLQRPRLQVRRARALLAIAARAAAAGVRVQVGSQVGETAILSAAGRHLAAALPEVAFVEGSFGTLLLTEDVSAESVRFGHRGEAPLLTGPGLGIRVLEERLRRRAGDATSSPEAAWRLLRVLAATAAAHRAFEAPPGARRGQARCSAAPARDAGTGFGRDHGFGTSDAPRVRAAGPGPRLRGVPAVRRAHRRGRGARAHRRARCVFTTTSGTTGEPKLVPVTPGWRGPRA